MSHFPFPHLRPFLSAFTSAFLCFLSVWMAALMLIHPSTAPLSPTTAQPSPNPVYLPDKSDGQTLLLCEDCPEPSIFLLVRMNPVQGSIDLFAFPKRLVLTHQQITEPAGTIFRSGGITEVCRAIRESFSIPVEHYLQISREQLPTILDLCGSTSLTLDQPLSLVVDGIDIVLEKGKQQLDGARLLLWFLSRSPRSDLEQSAFLSQTAALCINQHLDWLSEERSYQLFSGIVNHSSTNLTFPDYDAARKPADFLAQLCPQAARAFLPEFIRNPDATLSLSEQDRSELVQRFC
jgi:hypothetical protein